jgi:hypothetical protein
MAPPATLPALQQWSDGSGPGYVWTPRSRIVVDAAYAPALTADAQTFAGDLALAMNTDAPAVVTADFSGAGLGDVFISLGSTDGQLGTEGYGLTVGPVLQVSASAAAGAFWATRTILQMLRQSAALPPGSARDWPQYPVRAVLVDNGGRTFPIGFWHNEIRELSHLKLNELMVYAPGLGLSDGQLRELSAFASAYHVNLVGQVNVPGHMDTAREGIPPQYELTDRTGAPISGALDLTNPAAVTWARQLVSRYMPLFSAPIWHAGGDEYAVYNMKMNDPADLPKLANYAVSRYGPSGTIEDVYRAFMNDINAMVKQQGKAMRMWNDDLYPCPNVPLDADITVEYWLGAGSLSPAQLAANGNHLVNANADTLYFDEHAPGFHDTSGQVIWETFDPAVFEGGQTLPGGATDPHLAGVKLSSWDVAAEDVGALERDLQPLHRAFGQRAWGSRKLFATWAQMTPVADAVGRAPGFFDTPAGGDPGAGSLPSSKAIVFAKAQNTFTVQGDGSILHTYYAGVGRYATEVVAPAGSAVGQPTAYQSGTQQHVFARGPDNHLHHWWTGAVSGGWARDDWTVKALTSRSPSLDLAGDPAGFLYGSQQHAFGRGTDGHLHHWYYSVGNNTLKADDWGGQFTGTPSAIAFGDTQNVFARAADGSLHHWWWQHSDPNYVHQQRWAGPLLAPDASPTTMDYAETDLHVFARDTVGHLQHWWYDKFAGATNVEDWTVITGLAIAGNPTSFVYGRQIHVLFRDAVNSHLDHIWYTIGGLIEHDDWSATTPGGVVPPAGDPWSYNFLNLEQQVFALDATGHVHHWYWRQSDNTLHQDTWQ